MEVKNICMIVIVILISICVFVTDTGDVTESKDGRIGVTTILPLSTEENIWDLTDPEETTEKDIHQAECSCGIYGRNCIYVNGKKICTCVDTHADRFGECTLCGCTGNSSGCQFDAGGEMVCNCSKGFAQQRNECKKCDCGENGHCGFYDTLKYCTCKEGYTEYAGFCRKCDCGENGRCIIYGMVKYCICNQGYQQFEGLCKECDCGKKGSCNFIGGKKTCYCSTGYSEFQGTCSACVCSGNNDCTFNSNGNKVCTCRTGYGMKNGRCTLCDCGVEDANCTFSHKKKSCQCPTGYEENYSISDILDRSCIDINECLDYQSCPNSTYCVNTPGSYDCECKGGYEPRPGRVSNPKEDGCIDIDECKRRFVCTPAHMRCINTIGSYRCECETGYHLNISSTHCEKDSIIPEYRPWWDAYIIVGCIVVLVIIAIYLLDIYQTCRKCKC